MNANESYKTCYYILVITVICLILINIFDAHQLYSYWDEVLNTLKLAKSNKYNKIYTICIKPQYIFRAVELTNILYTSFIVLILITISNSQRGESTNIILFSCVKSIVFWYGPLQLILCLLAFYNFESIFYNCEKNDNSLIHSNSKNNTVNINNNVSNSFLNSNLNNKLTYININLDNYDTNNLHFMFTNFIAVLVYYMISIIIVIVSNLDYSSDYFFNSYRNTSLGSIIYSNIFWFFVSRKLSYKELVDRVREGNNGDVINER